MLLELYVKHNYSVLRGTLPLEFVAMNVIKTVHTLIKLFVFVVLSVIYNVCDLIFPFDKIYVVTRDIANADCVYVMFKN